MKDPIAELLWIMFGIRAPDRSSQVRATDPAPLPPRACWGYLMGAARDVVWSPLVPRYLQQTEVHVDGATVMDCARAYLEQYEPMRARKDWVA